MLHILFRTQKAPKFPSEFEGDESVNLLVYLVKTRGLSMVNNLILTMIKLLPMVKELKVKLATS